MPPKPDLVPLKFGLALDTANAMLDKLRHRLIIAEGRETRSGWVIYVDSRDYIRAKFILEMA